MAHLERREDELAAEGILPEGGKVIAESPPVSQEEGARLESRRLAKYKKEHGRLPKENAVIPRPPGARDDLLSKA